MFAATVAATAAGLTGAAAGTAGASANHATPATAGNSARSAASLATSAPPGKHTTATLHTARASVGGATETILVNNKDLPLYLYKHDTTTTSRVSGELAALWPPLVARAPSANGAAGSLKVVDTPNGHQVTYNGHFLYTFVEDSPGHVTGQGVQNFFVVTPGISAKQMAASARNTTPAPARYSYGY
jgi:predicted lipoprotein with Yx(FWY)xxD motif